MSIVQRIWGDAVEAGGDLVSGDDSGFDERPLTRRVVFDGSRRVDEYGECSIELAALGAKDCGDCIEIERIGREYVAAAGGKSHHAASSNGCGGLLKRRVVGAVRGSRDNLSVQ